MSQKGVFWYRAARYDTQQEAWNALNKLKAGVAHLRGENLLTVMFSNPAVVYFVAAVGVPTPSAREQVEQLISSPVTLTNEEIGYMRNEVTKLRREAGMSDREASKHVEKKMEAAGAPEDMKRKIANDFRDGFEQDRLAQGQRARREDATRLETIELDLIGDLIHRFQAKTGRTPDERDMSNMLLAHRDNRDIFTHEPLGEPFTGQLASSSPALPGLEAGASLKMQRIPFIIGYRDLQALSLVQTPEKYHVRESEGTQALGQAMNAILRRKLKRADKYQFDLSAIAMLDTVREPNAQAWLPLENHLWIEFTQGINTQHGEDVRALYVHSMDLESDIKEVAPAGRDLATYRLMIERNTLYKGYWSFNVITGRCKELFDFTYDVAQGSYVYLYSHVCPYGACNYSRPETRYDLGECSPCLECRAALAYWASVLHTAIRIIRREFALAPEEPRPYPITPEGYTETVKVKVGKGKNAHKIAQEKRREVDYRLDYFGVSEIGYPARALGEEIIEREESAAQEKGKRANWLTLADKGAIIWEYREIDTSRGRTLDPERNARWKSYQHVEIAPFKKWIPMLARERKTIKRVTARRYAAPGRAAQEPEEHSAE